MWIEITKTKNELIKFKQLYKIVWKDKDEPIRIISEIDVEDIKKKWINWKPIDIWWELYNPYEIKKVVKYTSEDFADLLENEPWSVKMNVKKKMELDTKVATRARIKEMIRVAREELYLN